MQKEARGKATSPDSSTIDQVLYTIRASLRRPSLEVSLRVKRHDGASSGLVLGANGQERSVFNSTILDGKPQ